MTFNDSLDDLIVIPTPSPTPREIMINNTYNHIDIF